MQHSIVSYGEILYDIFPAYRRMGGAPFNFAYHLYSLGYPCTFVSRVGDDPEGQEIIRFLKTNLGAASVQIDPIHGTGKVLVGVDEKGVPDFQIVEDRAYDYIAYDAPLGALLVQDPALIYFGTLAQRSPVSRSSLDEILARKGTASILYDMNLRQKYYSKEIVGWSLDHCNILKINEDELKTCKSLFERSGSDRSFVPYLMDRFALTWCSLTRGAEGSELYDGARRYVAEPVPQQDVADTVGAGDAYAAILALGVLNGWEPEMILRRATEFSAAVCTIQGAIPEGPGFYEPFLPWTKEGGQ